MTIAAMLTAMSVVIGIFCKSFLNFGVGLFRVTFENLPILLAGIMFGPAVGGVVGAASDIVSYLMTPQAYPINLIVTVGATMMGVISGTLSHYVFKKRGRARIIVSAAIAHIICSMIIKPIGLYSYYGALVLWRIPLYLVIAPLEITLICIMYRNASVRRVMDGNLFVGRMRYDEAIEYIHSTNWQFCNPGLERVRELCEKLGNPQDSLKFVHVAGTNGKGSFCAMTEAILRAQGYKVGLFTSPYILEFGERMRINGENISKAELCELVEVIKPIADKMKDKPTEFELITALAFLYFAKNNCDIVVLECGLGGRLDATNIIKTPILSVITGIALDHTSILGNTIEEIAAEKAGIIKAGAPVLWCGNDERAESVVRAVAADKGAPMHTVDRDSLKINAISLEGTDFDYMSYKNLRLALLGSYQPINARNSLTALSLIGELGFPVCEGAIREGLEKVVWHARFEVISKEPLIIADGGHNPEGIDAAVESIEKYFSDGKVLIVTGVMADKDHGYMASRIATVAQKVFCLAPDNPRALPAKEYADEFISLGIDAVACESVSDAMALAKAEAENTNLPVVALGSLYMYGEVVEALKNL